MFIGRKSAKGTCVCETPSWFLAVTVVTFAGQSGSCWVIYNGCVQASQNARKQTTVVHSSLHLALARQIQLLICTTPPISCSIVLYLQFTAYRLARQHTHTRTYRYPARSALGLYLSLSLLTRPPFRWSILFLGCANRRPRAQVCGGARVQATNLSGQGP